ncbi:MAG: hypothetical protein AAF614_05910 [Chloroflexota bacterium]
MYAESTFNQYGQRNVTVQEQAGMMAEKLFARQQRRPFLNKVKALFNSQSERLAQLEMVETAVQPQHGGQQTIAIDQICGSATSGRRQDFDSSFRPLNSHTKNRWVSIATARRLGKRLPPVQLVQVGNQYFIEDGHHRISVATAFGDTNIEATVTIYSA